jgi:hypothetical protein
MVDGLTVADKMHETLHRICLRGVVRDAGIFEHSRRFAVVTDPDREHRLWRMELIAVLANPAAMAPAASAADASAVGTFMTRMASFSRSANSASRATV